MTTYTANSIIIRSTIDAAFAHVRSIFRITGFVLKHTNFENVFDGIASLVSNSSSGQVKKVDFNRAKKDRTKQKIKECAKDILLGKKDFNSLDEDDFVFTGETNNSIALALSAVAPLVGADRGVSNYILEEKAKKREGELKPIKALIKEYKAKIDELK